MEAIFVTGIVFLAIYKIIELFVQHKGRKIMIEKMSQISSEDLQSNLNSLHSVQFSKMKDTQFITLRAGALALGIGIGWLVGWALHMQVKYEMTGINMPAFDYNYFSESVVIATSALFAGIALIIVYFIERKAVKTKKEE